MRKLLVGFGILVAVVLVAAGGVAWMAVRAVERDAETVYADVESPALSYPQDQTTVARGAYLYRTRGCVECHGDDGGGRAFIEDAEAGLRVAGSNLTTGKGGVGDEYGPRDWPRAIRHGLKPDKTPIFFMPSHEMYHFADREITAMVAYIKTLPPVDRPPPEQEFPFMFNVLHMFGEIPLYPAKIIDHDAPRPPMPPVSDTVEYGAYAAKLCVGCHGEGYSGGPIPGAPPSWPPASNLTPHSDSNMSEWTEAEFLETIRTNVRPDGTEIDEAMPVEILRYMSDTELRAIWRYLQTLEPKPFGNR